MKRTPLPRPTKRIRARNPKRQRREFARAYGSEARVEWVKRQPCVGCGRTGYTENAHIVTGGTGRKADYDKIVPLCGRSAPKFSCHDRLHRHGREDLELWGSVDLAALAAETERRWLEVSA